MDTPLGIHALKRENSPEKQQPPGTPMMPFPGTDMIPLGQVENEFCARVACKASRLAASPYAFACATGIAILWLLAGPFLHLGDMIIKFGTLVTCLMVFLIQSTQNRNNEALHLKLDTLLLAMPPIKNDLMSLEKLSQAELEHLKVRISTLAGIAKDSSKDAENELTNCQKEPETPESSESGTMPAMPPAMS